MKNVLIIGYPFPLRKGGSPRLLGLAKYLPEFGWRPIILTAPLDIKQDSQYTIVETGYRNTLDFWGRVFKFDPRGDVRSQIKNKMGVVKKKSALDFLMTLAGEIINYPDSDKGWKPYALKTADSVFARENIQALISTSAPITAHIIARKLKLRYKLPWIADLRDLWTQNHNYSYGRLRKYFDKNLEVKTLGAADTLTTVSPPWADELAAFHKAKKVHSIVNGFDPDLMNTTPIPLTKRFTITYTGQIYPGKQDPVLLFKALAELISNKTIDPEKLEIRFYGSQEKWLEKEAADYGLEKVVRQYGQVSRDESLQRQRESQVLLLLNWDDPTESGTIPGKIFEYAASLRPVIAIGGKSDDVIQTILAETGTGEHVSSISDVKEWLQKKYLEYSVAGAVSQVENRQAISKYSHREMARKFADILDGITNPAVKS